MKILYVNSVCGVGSTGKIVTDLASTVAERGHICSIAYGLGTAQCIDGIETIKISNKICYYASNFFSKLTGFTGFLNSFATYKLIRYIKKFKPDLIHLHNLHGYYVNFFKLFKFLSKADIPVVYTLHDCWVYTGNCSYYSYVDCQKWQTSCGNCPQIKRYPKSWFFDFSKYMFKKKKSVLLNAPIKAITTPSKWLCNEVEKSFLKKIPCLAIYNGMDTEKFRIKETDFKQKNNFENKKIVLGVANAWGEKKGLYDFHRLAEMLPKEYQVVLVGLDDNQMSSLPKKIFGIKRTEVLEELIDIYNSAEVFVNPSYEETFGLVTAEALLCGVQVVTYDKTAVPEVASAPYGVSVKAGDVNAVLNEIVNLKHYDRNEIRNSALKYSKINMFSEYLKLYERVAGDK